MCTFNPDAPVSNSGNWLQHTYQPQQNDSFYWGGSFGGSAFGPNMGYNDGSRRNIMNPVNPFGNQTVNPFNQYGQTQPNTTPGGIPETAVQPFSSYPPSTPTQYTPNMGLNSMVESRRNIPCPPQNQNNPWAPQQQQTNFQFPSPSTPPINWNQPQSNPFSYPDPGMRVDMNTVALYNNNNQFGFDKRNSWENSYSQYRPLQTPCADWNTTPQTFSGYPQYQQAAVQYPNMNQIPTSQQSWKDIAIKNWDMVK